MPSNKTASKGPGRPAIYPFGSMAKGEKKTFDTKKNPGAVQSAYQMGHRTGAKFSVHKLPGSTSVQITRTA